MLTGVLVIANLAMIAGAATLRPGHLTWFFALWCGGWVLWMILFAPLRVLTGRMSGSFSIMLDEREREWRHRVSYLGYPSLIPSMTIAIFHLIAIGRQPDRRSAARRWSPHCTWSAARSPRSFSAGPCPTTIRRIPLSDNTLTIDRVSKRYGDKVAIDEVSFEVGAGELFGFVGGNGAGKTTTMRIVLGVVAPDSGAVRVGTEPVTHETRTRIGYLPEERGLYPKMKVLDQLVYLAELHGLHPNAAHKNAENLISRLELSRHRTDEVAKLNLGNRQRVQLAAALVHEPTVLVLDEPFSGLDPLGVDLMGEVLREQAATGVPVLFSSHQLDLVERLCDRVGIIQNGRMIACGTISGLTAGSGRPLVDVFRGYVTGDGQ